ncbi:major facilitator superfamily domain-containing protein, partial [Lactifluus subvellereus]
DIDLSTYHEKRAGRLVLDPIEARIEFGNEIASRLKLSPDGKTVLWPQPTDDPEDPQNWSEGRKTVQLIIVTLAAVVPDFDSGIGIASIFALANQYHTTTGKINNLTSNWSIFLLGWGTLVAVMLVRRYGRLPVLFWSQAPMQVLALGFLVGCTFAPNLKTFTAMRCLTAFFGTCPQATGLYVVTDMYPFHRQARKLNIWTMGFLISPFLSPFAFGFLVARASWRWTYGIGSMYGALVLFLIAFLGRETMYDRGVRFLPPRPTGGLRYRVETLVGITGMKMAKYRATWSEAVSAPFKLFWRPHLLSIMVFEAMLFGFGIGINVTNAVFLGSPPPVGYGFSQYAIAGAYGTPMVVAVIIGELIGHFVNDAIMHATTRFNHGVFEAESRLWQPTYRTCYIAILLYVCGFVVLGAALEKHLSVGALVMGWGIAEVAVMVNTVAVYAYANDCFPKHQGEISALLNLARTLGGFSVAYFQVPWATKHGALQTFGCEAAIVSGLFVLTVPTVQLTGRILRVRGSASGFLSLSDWPTRFLRNASHIREMTSFVQLALGLFRFPFGGLPGMYQLFDTIHYAALRCPVPGSGWTKLGLVAPDQVACACRLPDRDTASAYLYTRGERVLDGPGEYFIANSKLADHAILIG